VSGRIEILALPHPDEIAAGTDLAALVLAAAPPLRDGDVVVVAHKAVSKSEGRVADLATVVPSARALELSAEGGDPRVAELVLRESRRIVRRRAGLLIAETHHGFVCASAGIDRSNGPAAGWVVLLPVDPDLSAARKLDMIRTKSPDTTIFGEAGTPTVTGTDGGTLIPPTLRATGKNHEIPVAAACGPRRAVRRRRAHRGACREAARGRFRGRDRAAVALGAGRTPSQSG